MATWMVGSILSAPHQTAQISIPTKAISAKRIVFNSNNGNRLVGWLALGDEQHGGILLMHGVRSNKQQMLNRAIFLNQAGYSVLLFDFQAHGESIGEHITFGYRESKDAEAAFDYLQQAIHGRPIGVIGVSLGGASALLGNVSQQAKAMMLESVYPSLMEAVKNRITMRLGAYGRFLVPILLSQVKIRLGFSPKTLTPIQYISSTTAAIFIVTGSEDKHTTPAESQRMFEAAPEPKQLWIIPKAIHQDFDALVPREYEKKTLDFFNHYLVTSKPARQ